MRIWSGYRFQDLGRRAPPIALWNTNTPPHPGRDTGLIVCLFLCGFPGRVRYFFMLPVFCCVMLICTTYKASCKTQLTFQSQCRIYVTQLNNNCRFKHCGCFAKLFGYDLIAWVPPRFPNWTPFQKEFTFKLIPVQERG